MKSSIRVCISIIFLSAILAGCGGGGGSDNACSALRIAGGDSCGDGAPNVAFILTSDIQGNPIGECTGAYVTLTSVLTAAHCFSSNVASAQIASRGNLRDGTSYYIHDLYDGNVGSAFDMAVIRVDKPLNGSPLPILLSRMPAVDEDVVAYGYGYDENGREAIMRIENGEAPLRATYTTFAGYVSGTAVITSTGAGSTCAGDSGGPVLGKNEAGEYGIIGITRAGPLGCDADKGRPSYLSSTQSKGAIDFLKQVAPDYATN